MNIVVVMLDSLRPDFMGCYGNPPGPHTGMAGTKRARKWPARPTSKA